MTIFEAVKTTVAPRMAAEHFGLSVSRNGMVCCPFHDDRHPSMKLYEDHYHCFGCQANGDVIAFTSKLFGITPLEAAQKLAADFGIREDRPSVLAKLKMYTTQAENEKLCFRVLSEYLHILQDWKKRYAPQTPEEEPDDRFVEACHMLECTQYMLDLLTIGSHEERAELVKDMMKDNKITLLQERLQEDGITPTYKLVETQGPPHDRTFVAQVFAGNQGLARGTGRTKKEAESQAAKSTLSRLGEFFGLGMDEQARAEKAAAAKRAKADKAAARAEEKARKKHERELHKSMKQG